MSAQSAAVGVMLVLLCAHVGVLIVLLVRGAVPQRRHPERRIALAAGVSALVGELLALGALVGRPTPPAWVAGILGLGLVLGILARGSWKEHAVGRAAFHAVVAAPLVLGFVLVLSLR